MDYSNPVRMTQHRTCPARRRPASPEGDGGGRREGDLHEMLQLQGTRSGYPLHSDSPLLKICEFVLQLARWHGLRVQQPSIAAIQRNIKDDLTGFRLFVSAIVIGPLGLRAWVMMVLTL